MLTFSLLAILLLLIACVLLIAPLRQFKVLASLIAVFFCISAVTVYWHWGSHKQWQNFEQEQLKQQEIAEVLKKFDKPQQVIDKLKAHLVKDPLSAKGWFLLGRLYMSQSQFELAIDAFRKARDLEPESIETRLNFAQALIFNDQNKRASQVLSKILAKYPKQKDALSLNAVVAFNLGNYEQSIAIWRQLLPLVPANSKESELIEKAINKAKSAQD